LDCRSEVCKISLPFGMHPAERHKPRRGCRGAGGLEHGLERRRVTERTARGHADARAKGVKFGRKPSLTPHQQQEARKRIEAGETQRSIARSYNVSQTTIARLAV
jgi:hypothetical protein